MSILLRGSDSLKTACIIIDRCYANPEFKIRTHEALEELSSDERECFLEAIKMTKNPSLNPEYTFEANQFLNVKLLNIANRIETDEPLLQIKDFGWSDWELKAINIWRAVKTFFGFRLSIDTLLKKVHKHCLEEDITYTQPSDTFTNACMEIGKCYANENFRARTEQVLEELTSEDRLCLIEVIKMTNKPLMVAEFATETAISTLSNKLRAYALSITAENVEGELLPIISYKDGELNPLEKNALDAWRLFKNFLGLRVSTDQVLSKINKFYTSSNAL